jgi:UDP-N-acetylglucosamine--N-acetylmuramyl-(pentapeptide) pyrophosphoryl-undecaprenol N-acetylglucosamine transferase
MKSLGKTLLIAGGGTGGHIFSGIAVAEVWTKQGGEVLFVGTALGQESRLVPEYGFRLKLIKVGRLKGGGIIGKLRTFCGLPKAMWQARKILKKAGPDYVFGMGGYASGPTLFMARLMGLKTAIIEQNAYPGFTNRVLGKFVHHVFLAFPECSRHFSKEKRIVSGNPLRGSIEHREYIRSQEKFTLFLFGGSQGARKLNEIFIMALKKLPALWDKLAIYHQAREEDLATIQEFYKENAIEATVETFFTKMSEIYQQAHLVICRAGAGTVTELALSGRPSILVPYPYAADDHQTKNAAILATHGAATLMDEKNLTAERLAEKIYEFYNDQSLLEGMAERAHQLAKPNAAEDIVDKFMQG